MVLTASRSADRIRCLAVLCLTLSTVRRHPHEANAITNEHVVQDAAPLRFSSPVPKHRRLNDYPQNLDLDITPGQDV